MRVQPSQLIPGCILLKGVMGKTKFPIVYEETIMNETHIRFLQKFLIRDVEVSNKLADGSLFEPTVEAEGKVDTKQEPDKKRDSLDVLYSKAVSNYRLMFSKWQQHVEIDIPEVRKYMLPLFERLEEFGGDIFTLHHYATKDTYIYHHSVSVGLLSFYVANKLGFETGEMLQTGLAGLLSDCGMARISPTILTKEKKEALDSNDQRQIKHHPIYSYRMVENIPTLSLAAKRAILQHHERQNGTGYPLNLTSRELGKHASIIAVCDTYHTMP